MPIRNGSTKLLWFAARSAAPSRGMCSRPIRAVRKYTSRNGWRIALVIQ
jgi:hypothetical protein